MQKLVRLLRTFLWTHGYVLMKSMPKLGRPRTITVHHKDHVRYSSLELVAHEINDMCLTGNVAELGVFRGDFARLINEAFPDRKFYLFDTFGGFDERDSRVDRERGYSKADDSFATSIETVLNKMKRPELCIVKKGWFPESAVGVEDEFAFVSLDVDLYQPTMNGLRFFYPMMVKGGYIFIHDYNNKNYQGVRPAVRDFCSEAGIGFFPLSDESGSVAIVR